MSQGTLLKKGAIRTSDKFRYKVKGGETKDGAFTIIARPSVTNLYEALFVPILFALVTVVATFFFAPPIVKKLPISETAQEWLFGNILWWIPGALVFLLLLYWTMKPLLPTLRNGGLKFVFFHGHSDPHEPTRFESAFYEIHYLGKLQDRGPISPESLCHATEYSKYNNTRRTYIRCSSTLRLKIKGPIPEEIRNHSAELGWHITDSGFHVFSIDSVDDYPFDFRERFDFVQSHTQELRDFLDLPLEGPLDYIKWDNWSLREYENNNEHYTKHSGYLFLPPKSATNTPSNSQRS